MKKTAAIMVLMAAGLISIGAAASTNKAALVKKQSALASEYGLAKEAHFYFVLDVLGRKLELRVRGMVLRTWPLQSIRFWGRPDFSGNVALVRKSTLKAPERIFIKPGDAKEAEPAPAQPPAAKPAAGATTAGTAEYELEALELKDMPRRFSLGFDNGLQITVKAKHKKSGGIVRSMRDGWRWYVERPLRHLFSSRRGGALAELELTFDSEKDAQSIYWHFFEGIKGLIF